MEWTRMMKGARIILDNCAAVKRGESVLIITDTITFNIAQVLMATVQERDAEPILTIINPRERDGQEPPLAVAEAMKHSDVILCPVRKSITHTLAVKNAATSGARILVMTAFNERLMISGGIEADFKAQKPICEKLGQLFSDSNYLHLTTPAGTDLTMNIEGRIGNALTGVVKPGQFSPIPIIEANISPIEGTSEGNIVVDASIPYIGIGLLKEPIKIKVEKGFINEITGGYQARILENDLKSKNDKNVYNIAEFGVGLNPKCQMTGIMLDDEGVLGSCHIGIGTNITLGGSLKAAIHYDLLMWKPTILLDEKLIMEKGVIKF